MNAWEIEQVAKLNAKADDLTQGHSREYFADMGGIFWLLVLTDGSDRVSKRYKSASAALKAYNKESARYSVIPALMPKSSGRVVLYVRRDAVLSGSWNDQLKTFC